MLASFAFYFFRIHLLASRLLTNTSTRLLYFKPAKALCSHLNRNDLWIMQSCCFFVIVNVSLSPKNKIFIQYLPAMVSLLDASPPPISFSSLLFVFATILRKHTPNIIEVQCSYTMLYNWTSPQHDMHRLHFSAQTPWCILQHWSVCLGFIFFMHSKITLNSWG